MKRFLCVLLLASLLLTGCTGIGEPEQKKYTATFLTLFDTITSMVGYGSSEEAFREAAQGVHDELLVYHQLFDIYNDYEGVVNLKTLNDTAALGPVTVDRKIIDLLLDCKEYAQLTGGRVNVAMGSVLYLWHQAREDGYNDPANAYLPDQAALAEAAAHTSLDALVIDEENSTVFYADPALRLDVGAIAKGWALQRVCENAPEGLLISVGGNVCATGPRSVDGTDWVVGVTDPDGGENYLHTIYLNRGSVVTSGDYQRAYLVDGVMYHHIIDPDTLFPSTHWRSVSIVCADSGLADALSTALFLLPYEEGLALLEKTGAEAFWIDAAGNRFYSPGFEALIRT
ncbi:MAG: FAD:protein FMN transferase [Oscillospiraceae bacterium]|nr:FAD:protein FMN transferase [Oscillospiraceae bacterium]